MSKLKKTLAMKVLDQQGIEYETLLFPDKVHDAEEVATHIGLPADNVYKTLVVESDELGQRPMLIMLAANMRLDPRKVAKAVRQKKVQMARHADAERLTGLKVGGISPLALLNRGFDIYIDEWATILERVAVSAGQRGINLLVGVEDLLRVTEAVVIDASQEKR